MTGDRTPTLWEIAIAYATIGLTSIGGAAGPLRHELVVRRRWISEVELAELYGIGQALPGSVVVNVTVLLNPRFGGPIGSLVALAGLIIPAMLVAIAISGVATSLAATNARFAAGVLAVTAALAGIFVSNGIRVLAQLWSDTPDIKRAWRCARIAIGALGVVLVVGLHVMLPIAMIVLVTLSMCVEWRLRNVVKLT